MPEALPSAASVPVIPREQQFVHLHLHTEYSLLDGGNRIDKLIARVKQLGMTAVGVTDHGNLFGAMTFYAQAKEAGIKPILGVEAYVAPGARQDRTHTGVADGGHHLVLLAENETGWRNLLYLSSEAYLTGFYYKPRMDHALLEKHGEGLIAINGHLGSELAFHLEQYENTKEERHYDAARKCAEWHAQVFAPVESGPRFFIELQRHIDLQNRVNTHLLRLAEELDLPVCATNDSHFLRKEDHDAHDTLICISMGKQKNDPDRLHYPTQLYVKSPMEMREEFENTPRGKEACDNTVAIAERCNVDLKFSSQAPVVKVVRPESPRKYAGEANLTEWFKSFCAEYQLQPYDANTESVSAAHLKSECDRALRELCEAGFVWRYGPDQTPSPSGGGRGRGAASAADASGDDPGNAPLSPTLSQREREPEGPSRAELRARLERELQILSDKNIAAYFLIVWDFVNWARQRGIPALARGSGVGTMVGFTLGLSNACPVRYGLLFERFTDPDRSEYPDIDIDLCQDGRGDVINYVRQKYGHVAQIITFGTLKARAAMRDIGRVFGMPLPEVDRIAKLIPEQLGMTLDKALDQEPELKKRYDSEPQVKTLIDTGRVIEGQARHASVHAAGVIVATRPLHEIVPLYKPSGSEDIVTQWDGPTCEKVGLLKMDFLGLRTLSTIERAKRLIRETLSEDAIRGAIGWKAPSHQAIKASSEDKPSKSCSSLDDSMAGCLDAFRADPLDLDRLTFDDQRVFELFRRADTTGVFQFESGGMRRLLTEMKPDRLEDLIAANALFRPGPMDLIPAYNKRKHKQEEVPRIHEIVERYTAETYGVMVYQEQVMQIVHALGGIPLRAAYSLIKAISKKKIKEIEKNRELFIAGAGEKGLAKARAEELFEMILKFAGYGFNKSHSTGYAIVAYQTAFLKTYFPNQYMAAFLTFESQAQKVEDWIKYKDDCRKTVFTDGKVGVTIAPPDINLSDADFTVVYDEGEPRDALHGHVRFGLKAIKGVGARAIDAIVAERKKKDGGRFRSLHDFCERMPPGSVNKATIEALVVCGAFDSVHGAENRASMVASIEGAVAAGQTLAKDRASGQAALFGFGGDEPAAATKNGAAKAAGGAEPALVRAKAWDTPTTLAKEKEVLGFYVSSHPLDEHGRDLELFGTADTVSVREMTGGQDAKIILGGLVKSVRPIVTQKGRSAGQRMAIVTMEDARGTMEAVLFAETYGKFGEHLMVDSIVFLVGKLDLSRGDPQIIVDRVVPIAQAAAQLATRVEVRIDERVMNGAGKSMLDQVAGLVRSNRTAGGLDGGSPGVPLAIVVRTEACRITLEAPSTRVALTGEFLSYLGRVVGPQNVVVSGQGRRAGDARATIPSSPTLSEPPPVPVYAGEPEFDESEWR